jgi:hypothetical protein
LYRREGLANIGKACPQGIYCSQVAGKPGRNAHTASLQRRLSTFLGGETMSTVSGTITRKNKSGRTVSKTKLGVRKKGKKLLKIPPVKALEFISKVKALAKRYQIQIDNLKIT